ncbi:MAG: hypothetical protein LBG61_05530 [Burkholderiales bacterium]|jgi:hypothetical protein|nr:hypothetical protein [Burkholderiales bacterium]
MSNPSYRALLIAIATLSMLLHYWGYYVWTSRYFVCTERIASVVIIFLGVAIAVNFTYKCLNIRLNSPARFFICLSVGVVVGAILGVLALVIIYYAIEMQRTGVAVNQLLSNDYRYSIKILQSRYFIKGLLFLIFISCGWLFGGVYSILIYLWLRFRSKEAQ